MILFLCLLRMKSTFGVSGMDLTNTPVDVASMLIACSRKSADFEERRNVHRYSSSLALYRSASSLSCAVTHSREMKVPTSAKQYLEAQYQKDWRCSGRRLWTKSIADFRRAWAAWRQMARRVGSSIEDRERMMRL